MILSVLLTNLFFNSSFLLYSLVFGAVLFACPFFLISIVDREELEVGVLDEHLFAYEFLVHSGLRVVKLVSLNYEVPLDLSI